MKHRPASRAAALLAIVAMLAATVGVNVLHPLLHQAAAAAGLPGAAPRNTAHQPGTPAVGAAAQTHNCPICTFLTTVRATTPSTLALNAPCDIAADRVTLPAQGSPQRFFIPGIGARPPPC